VGEQAPIPGLTCEDAVPEALGEPVIETRQARKKAPADPARTEAARAKRAEASAAKRAAAVAEAAGDQVRLPAVLTRDLEIREGALPRSMPSWRRSLPTAER
jgi:hypothetical protein